MKLGVFSIRDVKTESFERPFFARSPGEAERSCVELVNDGQSVPSNHPEDFDLYYLGKWDPITGSLGDWDKDGKPCPLPIPQFILKLSQLKKAPREDAPLLSAINK